MAFSFITHEDWDGILELDKDNVDHRKYFLKAEDINKLQGLWSDNFTIGDSGNISALNFGYLTIDASLAEVDYNVDIKPFSIFGGAAEIDSLVFDKTIVVDGDETDYPKLMLYSILDGGRGSPMAGIMAWNKTKDAVPISFGLAVEGDTPGTPLVVMELGAESHDINCTFASYDGNDLFQVKSTAAGDEINMGTDITFGSLGDSIVIGSPNGTKHRVIIQVC